MGIYYKVDVCQLLRDKAREELIRFDLERYKKLYFKDVHTYPKEEFETYLQALGLV